MPLNFYDTSYPDCSGDFVLVDLDAAAEDLENVFEGIEETAGDAEHDATKQWFLVTSDPRNISWPARWKDLSHPKGGIPRNVWVGLRWSKPEQVAELAELRRVRARRLFVIVEWGPGMLDDAKLDFEAWRCSSCGMRGEHPRPRDCPNTMICDRDTVGPQIHWIVGDVTISKEYGILVWSKLQKERPE